MLMIGLALSIDGTGEMLYLCINKANKLLTTITTQSYGNDYQQSAPRV